MQSLAIIGLGPRGLYALESYIAQWAGHRMASLPKLLLFEESDCPGAGPNYHVQQLETNLLNVPERSLELPARPSLKLADTVLSGFPDYLSWAEVGLDPSRPDVYPPRAKVGRYLVERLESLLAPLQSLDCVELIQVRVDQLQWQDEQFELITGDNRRYYAQEVLLTIGHQPTRLDKQLSDWQHYAKENERLLLIENPYPIRPYLSQVHAGAHIAIRGFGLSMIDLARALAERFGRFEQRDDKLVFDTKGSEFTLIPFALAGLAVAPKPLSAQLDARFQPEPEVLEAFEQRLKDRQQQAEAQDRGFVIEAFLPLVKDIYAKLHGLAKADVERLGLEDAVRGWLDDESFEHELILSQRLAVVKQLRSFLAMAKGQQKASLDYCLGQVWRHCQYSLYDALSYAHCQEAALKDIIVLHERMKRYSFGPPVQSIEQMLALVESGAMTLDFVADPDILLLPQGWRLKTKEKHLDVLMMINSVLDAPDIAQVNSTLVANLKTQGLMPPVGDDLGVRTDEDGYILKEQTYLPLAVLGRLAKGTIIGADSLPRSFGERTRRWAQAAARRLVNQSD